MLAWLLLTDVAQRLNHADAYRQLADIAQRLESTPELRSVARLDRAWLVWKSGDAQDACRLYADFYDEVFARGLLPRLDRRLEHVLPRGSGASDPLRQCLREGCDELLDVDRPTAALLLAAQCHLLDDADLADELLEMTLARAAGENRHFTLFAAADFLSKTDRHVRADALIAELLEDPRLAENVSLWRWRADVAKQTGRQARSLEYLERAVTLAHERLPDVVDLESVRTDHAALMERFFQVVRATTDLDAAPPEDFVERVVRAADRWRRLDDDDWAACQAAARVLSLLGECRPHAGREAVHHAERDGYTGDGYAELAWDYLTSPLARRPNEAAAWLDLAKSDAAGESVELADRAFREAFDAEPTNAEILWDHAQRLMQAGRTDEGRELLKRIATGNWQPRFQYLIRRAVEMLGP
jgi:tetratricopeptide (TPR) repeat protein